jgi:hypothetical protein
MLAPVLFAKLGPVEYPIAILAACLVRPSARVFEFPRRDVYWLLGFTAILVSLNVLPWVWPVPSNADPLAALIQRIAMAGSMFGIPAAIAFGLAHRALRMTLALALLVVAGAISPGTQGPTLELTRNFFGTLRVVRSSDGRFARLYHGTTQHGQERLDEPGPPRPLMYYHTRGPVGQVFAKLPAPKRVAAVGLGVGAMAYYSTPGSHWTFYEIDPNVLRIARDSGHFHFLASARGTIDHALGDARVKLAQEPDGSLDLLVLDAFSSDAIPIHLLTQEAFALYAKKLKPTGVMLFHVSNRYLDLVPVLVRLGQDHHSPFECRVNNDFPNSDALADGQYPSIWVLLARQPEHLGPLDLDRRFQRQANPGPLWTDHYANLLDVLKRDE